jgi:hypothetical protein
MLAPLLFLARMPGAAAHSFGTPYVLPLPLWLYAYGCIALLVATFLILLVFFSSAARVDRPSARDEPVVLRIHQAWVQRGLRAGAVLILGLSIWSGFRGPEAPGQNIGMNLFWIVLLLVGTYVTALVGNVYRLVNPWRTLAALLPVSPRATVKMGWFGTASAVAASLPSLALYLGLLTFELVGQPSPRETAAVLMAYTVVNCAGAWILGSEYWFARVEVLSVYFGFVARAAPIELAEIDVAWQARWRGIAGGLVEEPSESPVSDWFVILMLAGTTYDAIRDTSFWISLYWSTGLTILNFFGITDLGRSQAILMGGYVEYRNGGILVLLILYVLLYRTAQMIASLLIRQERSTRALMSRFSSSLVPIAVAYNFVHYFPFALSQCTILLQQMAVALGRLPASLNESFTGRVPMSMGIVWHVQVGVLLGGHLLSVWAAHRIADRYFPSRRSVVLSQMPLLLLMLFYTVAGLWILALPLSGDV